MHHSGIAEKSFVNLPKNNCNFSNLNRDQKKIQKNKKSKSIVNLFDNEILINRNKIEKKIKIIVKYNKSCKKFGLVNSQ